jgi:excisionase family DNA binding protein
MTPDRCPVCDTALSFTDEDGELSCQNGHRVPDALMSALARLTPGARELAKVIAGIVLAGMGSPEEEHSNGLVDARVIADETGFHVYRRIQEGEIPAIRLGSGRAALRIPRAELEHWLEHQVVPA